MARGSTICGALGVLALWWAPAAAQAAGRCPGDGEIRKQLQLEGEAWLTTCRPDGAGLLLAALMPPEGRTDPPEVVVAATRGRRLSLRLASGQDKRMAEITPAAEQWTIGIDRTRLGGDRLIRIRLTASWGGNQLYRHDLIALVRESGDGLRPVWIGLGDWQENRFDICLLSGRTSFRLLPPADGKGPARLERLTRIQRRRGTAPVDEAPARQVQKECEPPPGQRDIFVLSG
jgi:hypothetical protein